MVNPIDVNPQMMQLANNAMVAAREKFGISLDFSDASLQQLDTLIQQAYEQNIQASSSENPANTAKENTVRIWGSYFGEVIRRGLGGDWIVDQKNVFLQIGSRILDPLGQVRSRLVYGSQSNLQGFYQGLAAGIQDNQNGQSVSFESEFKDDERPGIKNRLTNKGSFMLVDFIFGAFILISLLIIGALLLQSRGILSVPLIGNLLSKIPSQENVVADPCNPNLLAQVQGIKVFNNSTGDPNLVTFKGWQELSFTSSSFDSGTSAKAGTLIWSIYPQTNNACAITLTGDVNGVPTLGYSWFVDLNTRRVNGDNPNAQEKQKGFAEGNSDLADGFPLP